MKKINNVWIFVVSVLLLIFGIVMTVMTGIGNEGYLAEYKSNNILIGDLYDKVAKLESDIKDSDSVEIVQANLKSCAEIGKRVAELQTNYQYINILDDEESFMSNVNALDACFDEFDKDARGPWYSVLNVEDLHWTWKFQSTYGFGGHQIDVLWLCYADNTEDLLAYATAVYNAETDLFSNVIWEMTTLGADYLYNSTENIDTPEPDNTNPIDSTIGGSETVSNETLPESTEALWPTDANGEPIFISPDDGGGAPPYDGGRVHIGD